MAQSENPAGALAALFLFGLIALAIMKVGQGGDIDNSILGWFLNHPDLFAGVIVLLVILGVVLNIAQEA